MIGAYLLGLATLPALALVYILVALSLLPTRGWTHCAVCGYDTPARSLGASLARAHHRMVIFPQRAHRAGLREWHRLNRY